jgi:hypothetical protein
VSSGSSGFWFCSWVVSSVRKVWKLPAIELFAVDDVLLDDDVVDVFVVPETIGLAVIASPVVAMIGLL